MNKIRTIMIIVSDVPLNEETKKRIVDNYKNNTGVDISIVGGKLFYDPKIVIGTINNNKNIRFIISYIEIDGSGNATLKTIDEPKLVKRLIKELKKNKNGNSYEIIDKFYKSNILI